jgi:CRP-like cAMP-binding protein
LFAFYFCGAIAAANERLEDRNGSARHRHLDGLAEMRIVIDGKDTEHGGPAGRPDAVKGLALVTPSSVRQRISVHFLFPLQTFRDVCPLTCIVAPALLSGIAVMASRERPPNQLLRALPEAEFEALRPCLRPFKMVRNAALAKSAVPSSHVCLPHAGAIAITVGHSGGKTLAVAMTGCDSIIGAAESLGGSASAIDAIVLFPGAASIVEMAELRTLTAQNGTLRTLLARHQQALCAQAQQSAACNASHTVEARLSRWLLRACDLRDGATLPMTQDLLARLIGVQRNAISIVAHALQQAGIIRYSRGHIEITDGRALQATACECYQTIKTNHERLLGIAH